MIKGTSQDLASAELLIDNATSKLICRRETVRELLAPELL
jgi:hypothetical protein